MQIINLKKEDLKAMNELWNEVVTEDYFYKTFTEKTTDPDNVVNRVNEMVKFINGEEIWIS